MNQFKLYPLFLFLGFMLFISSCEKSALDLDLETMKLEEISSDLNVIVERNCGMQEHMNLLLQDEEYRKAHLEKFTRVRIEQNSGSRAECQNKIIIPVAVHFQRIKNADLNCLRAQAQNQIDILNDDYAGTNVDISLWSGANGSSSLFSASNGEACIEFCIATQNHPGGYGLADGDPAVTLNVVRGDSDNNWAGYINIFVRSIQYLGYSPLGGSGNGDGVVIDNNNFGSISCSGTELRADYDLGRTLTHELGHYLFLDHIWGGGCGSDDGITDTPDSEGPYYNCPANGVSTCGSTDMHMNYMDYVDDRCMYMFSAGQATVMEGYVSNDLANVVANAATVCGDGPPPPPTCEVPSGMTASVNKKKVNISWDAQDGATFEVRYKKTSDTSWTTKSSGTNSITLNGVRSGNYEYQVRAICGNPTAWSASNFFSS